MDVLITGAHGFVGKLLCSALRRNGDRVFGAVRRSNSVEWLDVDDIFGVGDVNASTNWATALKDKDVVVHLAARVHIMRDTASDSLAEFRKVNVEGTEHLARTAAAMGVKRLVYVSSIKVNGEETCGDSRYAESDVPSPKDPYGVSKCEAEQVLSKVAEETGMEVVIVRPPLVYGPGVKGNFEQMLNILAKGIPLPLAWVRNRRSLLYVENLTDALVICSTHPAAAGKTYLISDGEDVSTPDLLRRLGKGMGRPARLFPCPAALLKLTGQLSGKTDQVDRLLGSLQVDSGKIRRELNWTPPYTLQQGLQATAEWYRNTYL